MNKQWPKFVFLALVLALVLAIAPNSKPASALSADVVISQVYGGGGNSGATLKSDFIELFNRGTSPVDLTGWSVQYASVTGLSWQKTDLTAVTLQPGQYYLIKEADGSGGTDPLPTPDVIGTIAMSGTNGKVALVNNNTLFVSVSCPTAGVVDFVGFGATANCSETLPTPNLSNTTAALRNGGGCTETDNNNADFSVVPQPLTPRNTSSPFHSCSAGDTAPTVTSTNPANNATGVAANTNIDITFSEEVTISGTLAVVGSSSGVQNLTPATGDDKTFTLDPADFTAGETVTVTVLATQVADKDGTPDNMAADFVFSFTIYSPPVSQCGNPATLISAVQGNGVASPINGSIVTIEGIVVGDFQDYTADPPNELSGFSVQEEDADADGDPATSEGVFVFDGQNPAVNVAVGDKVRVTGKVDEFNSFTEIINVTNVEICSSGNTLPTAATIILPVTALSDYEKYEGMLVTFPQELTVTEVYTLGRYGEVLLSQGGRLPNPTHAAAPGAPAQAVRDANILRSIILDDGLTNQNPDPVIYPAPELSASNTLRGGDTTTGLTGVMYYLGVTGEYRIEPTGTVTWSHDNPRPATPPVMTGTLTVVGMNTLNFFTTVDNGPDVCGPAADMDCRGADSASEFTRQRDKLINALVALNADIVGLNELENNAAASPAGDGSDPVLESIVNGLNAHFGAGTYSFIDAGVIGSDAIKVGLIYKPATVMPVSNFAILDSSVDPDFDTTRNRPALAQTFEEIATGERLTVVVNHLKSKGSACAGDPDTGDLQGNCNITRTMAATALANWLATDPTGSGDPDFLIIGDLNSYAKEDPISALVSAGYTDLAAAFHGADAYSYVFDGEWGYLDYGMSSSSLTPQVTSAAEWHNNADEPIVLDYNTEFKSAGQKISFYSSDPFRVSDHDPMIIGLTLSSVVSTPAEIFVSTTAAGTVGSVSFGSEDVLKWDGSAWSVWFDGTAAGLAQTGKWKHNLNAIYIPDPNGQELIMSFAQNRRRVPGIIDLVDGMDLVRWDGNAFSLWFDGSDVGLAQKTQEKIDGLHVLDGSLSPVGGSCLAYLLISTQGPGRVNNPGGPSIRFSGEDVLGFCATNLGPNTAGFWTMVLDGSAEGMPRNSTESISASDDGSVIYLTTKKAFHVDSAVGGHSMVYRYDVGTGTFSGPYFSAPANGLQAKVDGIHVWGDLP